MTEFTEVEKIMNDSLAIVTLGMMMVIFITTSDYYPDLYLPNFIRVFSYPQLVPGKWFFWTTPSHLLFFFAIAFTVTVTLDPNSPGWKYLVYTCLIFIGFFIVVRMKNFFCILLVLILLILEKIIYKKWIETGTAPMLRETGEGKVTMGAGMGMSLVMTTMLVSFVSLVRRGGNSMARSGCAAHKPRNSRSAVKCVERWSSARRSCVGVRRGGGASGSRRRRRRSRESWPMRAGEPWVDTIRDKEWNRMGVREGTEWLRQT
jgi:hypothetical protein